ncbi:MAG TPA: PPK2 family polyphosphate kinase [Gemmatimonadaceae bacterium]|nr:PPK2 family polyphosphate kinase [Gemmatimonadaceae bacterium]
MADNRTKLRPVLQEGQIALEDKNAERPRALPKGKRLKKAAKDQRKRIEELQDVFYADGRFALLVVLQGRDTSGKDGTVKHVFRSVNPMGCEVTSFKAPTEFEREQGFLWRIERRVPAKRMIGIFNRSHYEDVIVPRVHGDMSDDQLQRRYEEINDFEQKLVENSVIVLKFFLHISREEQKKRFIERLENPRKNWKFREGDLDDRALWDSYTEAFHGMIANCSTRWARWYIVPANDEDARNLLVARTIADALDRLKLRYPRIDPKLKKLKIE